MDIQKYIELRKAVGELKERSQMPHVTEWNKAEYFDKVESQLKRLFEVYEQMEDNND